MGNDITSQGSAVTSLSNSLNTVNQANGNLWVDGSFESYAEGTTFSGATAMVTKAYRYSGGQCLRVRRDGGDKGNSDKTFGTRTTVRDQGVFRIEFYAMMPASESPPSGWVTVVGIHVQDTNGANQWVEAAVVSEVRLGGRDKWVKFSGTAALGGGKTRGVLWISTRGTSGGAGYNLFIDELVITDVTDAAGAQKTADAASSALTSLSTKVTSIDGQVTANSTALTKLTSRVNDAESSITGLNETVAQNGLAMANGFNQMRSMIGDNSASITQTNKTVTDLEKSTAEQVNTLNSKYGDMSATVQQTASTVADINGKLGAQWGVKVATGNGGTPVVAGIQLGINGQGWLKQGSVSTIDGYPALNSTAGWQPSSGKFQVTAGDILDLAVSIQVSAAVSLAVGVRFDGPSVSNVTAYTGDHAFTAGEKYRFEKPGIVVPAGCTTAFLQTNGHTTVTVSLYNPVVTRRTAGTTANAAAINSLTTRVTAAEGAITSQSQSVTALSSSLNRRTVFTVCSLGMGGAGAPGIFSESGARLFLQTRSYALITFRKNGDGSTSIDTSRTYDVFSSVANGKALNDAIAALANGVYACVVTFDEPSGNRASIIDGIRLLGGTPDVINALPYRGAYILLGQKNGSAGSGGR